MNPETFAHHRFLLSAALLPSLGVLRDPAICPASLWETSPPPATFVVWSVFLRGDSTPSNDPHLQEEQGWPAYSHLYEEAWVFEDDPIVLQN